MLFLLEGMRKVVICRSKMASMATRDWSYSYISPLIGMAPTSAFFVFFFVLAK